MRSAEDIAFHVTLFIAAKKGSFVNHYMVLQSSDNYIYVHKLFPLTFT